MAIDRMQLPCWHCDKPQAVEARAWLGAASDADVENQSSPSGLPVPELTCGRLQSGRILPDDYDGRTFLPKQLRSFKSHAGSSAGNEDDFVRQFHDLLLVRRF